MPLSTRSRTLTEPIEVGYFLRAIDIVREFVRVNSPVYWQCVDMDIETHLHCCFVSSLSTVESTAEPNFILVNDFRSISRSDDYLYKPLNLPEIGRPVGLYSGYLVIYSS